MRNAYFGVIVGDWYTYSLSVIGPPAIALKNAPSVSSESLWMKCFASLPKTRKLRMTHRHSGKAWH
jgi:hypothetical protein